MVKTLVDGMPLSMYDERGVRKNSELNRIEELTIERLKLANRFQLLHCDEFYLCFTQEMKHKGFECPVNAW